MSEKTRTDLCSLHATMDISEYRDAIDNIDIVIAQLLIMRMNVIRLVKPIKEKYLTSGSHISAKRGAEVVRNAFNALKHDYPKEHIIMIWRAIISASELVERRFVVANSSERCCWIAREFYGSYIEHKLCSNTDDMIDMLDKNQAQFGSAPMPQYDLADKWWMRLMDSDYKVYAIAPFHEGHDFKPVLFIGEVALFPGTIDITLIVIKGDVLNISLDFVYLVIDEFQDYKLLSVQGFISHTAINKVTNQPSWLIGSYAAPIKDSESVNFQRCYSGKISNSSSC